MRRQLVSALDASRNWILPRGNGKPGMLECRYVRRAPEYVSVYVSSHFGCSMGCQFCHLTHMGTEHRTMKSATLEDYTHQFSTVLQHVREQAPPVERVNVNFMARGDCLANPTVLLQYPTLYDAYADMVPPEARLKMNMSTIMPHTVAKRSLVDVFRDKPAHLYYSLYSTQDAFRKRWMPKAIPYQLALDKLKEYQDATGHEVTFHWAFIRGQNDKPQDVEHLCRSIQAMQFKATKFNLVRLNPPPGTDMQEPEEAALKELWSAVNSVMKDARGRGRIVERIGKDVNASCGMFTA